MRPRSLRWVLAWLLLGGATIGVGIVVIRWCSSGTETPQTWVLHDSSPSSPTSFDPIRITDAFTTTVLANVYEGLVRMDASGDIVPAIAQAWDVESDGRLWSFRLRPSVAYHVPQTNSVGAGNILAADVVFSLSRCITDPSSMYSWLFLDLVEGASEAKKAGAGSAVSGLRVIDATTVEIALVRPFPLLDRLVMSGAWVYPQAVIEAKGDSVFENGSIGTGPYQLARYVPDGTIELAAFPGYWNGTVAAAPDSVLVHVEPDPLAAIEAFRRGALDVVQLELETISAGRAIEERGGGMIHTVTSNELDYLVMNLRAQPFDDERIRKAIGLAIDRPGLAVVLSDLAIPAYGFLPPASRSYRGRESMMASGFREDLGQAQQLVDEYLRNNGLAELELTLAVDVGEFPETVGQFLQDRLQRLKHVRVELMKQTWPELLQSAFRGEMPLYRFWWNVVTPGEDVYFLFYMPGQEPPAGFNFSFYANQQFAQDFVQAFTILDVEKRRPLIQGLEDRLISDAVAVPLVHRKFSFLLRDGLDFPINRYLGRPYRAARR